MQYLIQAKKKLEYLEYVPLFIIPRWSTHGGEGEF